MADRDMLLVQETWFSRHSWVEREGRACTSGGERDPCWVGAARPDVVEHLRDAPRAGSCGRSAALTTALARGTHSRTGPAGLTPDEIDALSGSRVVASA